MATKIKSLWEPLRTLGFGAIGAGFTALGTPLTNSSRNISIVNTTDVLLTFSTDGVNAMFVCPSNVARIWDIAAMRVATGEDASIHTLTQFYVSGTPTLGSVYLETIYLG